MRATWRDERLAHNDSNGTVVYPLTEIWHPHFQWINQQKAWETFPYRAEVTSDGEVTYVQRVWGQFSQPLRLEDFPFDQQEFNLTLISSGYSPEEVQLIQNQEFQSGIADQLSIAGWEVMDWEAVTATYEPFYVKPFSAFNYRVNAKRGTRFYLFMIVFPLMLIVAMSWVVFWIDPKEGGTQIGVGMTSMLTLIAYRFAVASSLPHLGYLTRMDHFLIGSTVLVFASLIEVIVTSYLARSERLELARRIDTAMRPLFPLAFVGIFTFAFIL